MVIISTVCEYKNFNGHILQIMSILHKVNTLYTLITFLRREAFSSSVKFSFSLSFNTMVSLLWILMDLGPGVIGVVGLGSWKGNCYSVNVFDKFQGFYRLILDNWQNNRNSKSSSTKNPLNFDKHFVKHFPCSLTRPGLTTEGINLTTHFHPHPPVTPLHSHLINQVGLSIWYSDRYTQWLLLVIVISVISAGTVQTQLTVVKLGRGWGGEVAADTTAFRERGVGRGRHCVEGAPENGVDYGGR